MEIQELLEQVKAGTLSIEEAKQYLRKEPFEELGYAKLDTHRKLRTGHAEVIYCEGKSTEHFLEIFTHLYRENGEVFGTRASKEQYLAAKERFPQTVYDETSRIIRIEKNDKPHMGKIVVCSAGTADIFVAEEAALTAEYFGNYVERIYDIGVCGIHRMLANLDAIQSANCIVAVAGMEGALASVLGGLVINRSLRSDIVGYGASFHGVSALLTMINSCANGVAVVNIDNGYGAGYMASQINRLVGEQHE